MKKILISMFIWMSMAIYGMAHADSETWIGTWKNKGGSIMTIEASTNNIITGYYQNNETTKFPCAEMKYKYLLTGTVNNDQITFTVNWAKSTNAGADCNSLAAWTGYYDEGDSMIKTKWNLVFNDSSRKDMIISSTASGDTFSLECIFCQ